MGQLIVLGFEAPAEAEEVRRELVELQLDHLIALEDAVVVVHHSEGKVELRQALNLTAAGAVSGGFWGSLVGLLFQSAVGGRCGGWRGGHLGGAHRFGHQRWVHAGGG